MLIVLRLENWIGYRLVVVAFVMICAGGVVGLIVVAFIVVVMLCCVFCYCYGCCEFGGFCCYLWLAVRLTFGCVCWFSGLFVDALVTGWCLCGLFV